MFKLALLSLLAATASMAQPHHVVQEQLAAQDAIHTDDACTSGLLYCGYNLMHKGDYYGEITAELKKHGQSTDDAHVYNSLYTCGIGGKGWIGFIRYCATGCADGGSGKSDFC